MWISFQFEKVNKIIIFYYIIISITYNFEKSFCTRSIENLDKPIYIYILTSYADRAAAYGSLYLITDDRLTYIVCDRMRMPKLFFLDLVIELVKQGEIEPKFAERIIKVASSRYSRGMVSHSFAILKEVLGNGRSKFKEA